MSNLNGTFVWYDLMTDDTEGALAFYNGLFGWKTEAMDMGPGGTYTMFANGERRFGGLEAKKMPEAPNAWIAYLGVDSVDGTVEKAQKMGAHTIVPSTEIPNIGQFAVLADPQGAVFAIYAHAHAPEATEVAPKGNGDFEWGELGTSDVEGAKGFYGETFNWAVQNAMEMPDGSTYTMMAVGEQPVCGIMDKPEMAPNSFWLHYVQTVDVDATAAKAQELGGTLVHGPVSVPGMVQFAVLADPGGALFGVAKSLMEK